MAEIAANSLEDANPEQAESVGGAGSLMGKLKVGGIVFGVVLAECMLAYFLIPSAADIAAMGGQLPPTGEYDPEAIPEDTDDENETEVDLGEFSITAYQRTSNSTLRIDFQLFGVVHNDDVSEFNERLERNAHRLRDNIIVTIRSAEVEHLSDAGLALIKRRILERTNKALGKPLVRRVIFSEFSFVEQ